MKESLIAILQEGKDIVITIKHMTNSLPYGYKNKECNETRSINYR